MCSLSRFCCCFDLRTGAIFSGFYMLVVCCVFLTKHAVWLRLLLVGEVHDSLEPFLDTLLRDRNDTWNPTALNLTAKLHRRNLVSHTLHVLWTSGGILTSVILLLGIFKKLPLLFLPWLSWCSVNGIILLVNAVVDIFIWAYLRLYSSMNLFTLCGYANLPIMVYLLFVTASYYQTLESIYEGNQLRCWSLGLCKRFCVKAHSPLEECPALRSFHNRGLSRDGEQCTTYGSTSSGASDQRGWHHAQEICQVERDSKGRSSAPSLLPSHRKAPWKEKKKCKPPKIRISQPSTESDW